MASKTIPILILVVLSLVAFGGGIYELHLYIQNHNTLQIVLGFLGIFAGGMLTITLGWLIAKDKLDKMK